MIIVEPVGGLCNRLRVINSAYFLSEKLDKKLYIIWNIDKGLNCSFYKLFNNIEGVKVIENRFDKLLFKFKNKIKSKKINQDDIMKYSEKDLLEMKNNEKIYIKTCSKFFDYENFNIFNINNDVLNKIIKYRNKDMIGIHIRRTDNEKAKDVSTICKFEKAILKEIEENEKAIFYLATDEIEVANNLTKKYKNIIFLDKSLNRNSEDGIVDALVDLMILANCKKVYGSYWSSFTDIACEFYNIQKIIVGIDT